MNERSFIVKSDLSSQAIPLSKSPRCRCLKTLVANRDKDAPLRRKLRHSAQRDALSYSPYLAAAFRISSATLLRRRAKQPDRVALRGRTQRTDLPSAAPRI